MLSLVLSTVAFFAASFLIKRQLEGMDIPKGVTRSMLVFALALAVAYGVAALVNRIWA